jgi:2-phosphosulfolactate phosphatase
MILDVVYTPDNVPLDLCDQDIAIVIDVLRAGTTICAMLSQGAGDIVIASSVDHALDLRKDSAHAASLVAGEQGGLPPEGFDMGNSPLRIGEEVRSKRIIFATTNGTRMLGATAKARYRFMGGFVNMSACVNAVIERATNDTSLKRLVLCCSGSGGRFSLEDTFFAGSFLARYIATGFGHDLTNAAEAALCIESSYNSSLQIVPRASAHAHVLTALGFHADVEACLQVDTLPVVPVCRDMIVRRL